MEKLVEMREDQADIRIAMGQRDQSIHEKIAQIQGHVESNVGILQDEVMAMDNQFKRIGKGKLPSQKFQKRESVSKKLSNSHTTREADVERHALPDPLLLVGINSSVQRDSLCS